MVLSVVHDGQCLSCQRHSCKLPATRILEVLRPSNIFEAALEWLVVGDPLPGNI